MTRRRVVVTWRVAVLALVISVNGAAQDRSSEPRSITRTIAPAQSHEYPVTLNAGDVLRADVAQDDTDVVLTLTDPDRRELLSVDASSDEVFPETLVAIADRAGTYTIAVRPAASVRAPGRYSIRIAPPRPATQVDRHVADAERAFADGTRLLDRAHVAGWPEAIPHLRTALAAYRDVADRRGEMKTLFAISRAQYGLHDPADLQSARDCERISRDLGERAATAEVLQLIGDILVYRGELTAAVQVFDEGIGITRELGHRHAEMRGLNDAALAYFRLGDAERAIGMLERGLRLARDARDTATEGNVLNNLGISYRQLGEYDRALGWYEQALANQRATGDVRGQMLALNNIGNLKLSTGRPRDALQYHRQALALARQIGSKEQEARVLENLGNTELQLGDLDQALEHERASLALRESIADVSGQAFTLERIGLTLQRLRRMDEAASALEQSLAIRRRIGQPYDETDSLFDLAQLEQARGSYAKAIGYATAATDLDEQLRRRISSDDLRLTFRASGEHYYELLVDLLQQHSPGDAAAASLDVSERARARVLLESVVESRLDRSRYVALPQEEPLTSGEIQRRVLDDDTVLLEFALGEERSWLWAVTPTTIAAVELPPRRQVDAAARQVYAQLSTGAPQGTAHAAAFSRMLLGGVAEQLRTAWRHKRLAIVPSGSLGYVPFAALPAPYGAAATPLSVDHEIVMAPSASVVAALRAEAARRPRASGAMAIVADPVFDAADPRVERARPRAVSTATTARAGGLPRLSFSRAEADAIAALAPAGSVMKATDFQASRAAVLGGALNGYRIVHIATHGVIDSDRPARSALILSRVDQTGVPQDGYVRQRDIYGMRLDADLVVLSACQTALGKDVRGEGLMGLTRAFMYAGTPRVIASLWEVGDRATAAFMTTFYRDLLQQHLRPAAALRAAQVEMARNPRWASPYYWAGFVLHGDWQ